MSTSTLHPTRVRLDRCRLFHLHVHPRCLPSTIFFVIAYIPGSSPEAFSFNHTLPISLLPLHFPSHFFAFSCRCLPCVCLLFISLFPSPTPSVTPALSILEFKIPMYIQTEKVSLSVTIRRVWVSVYTRLLVKECVEILRKGNRSIPWGDNDNAC